MTTPIRWPRRLLKPKSAPFLPVNTSRGGGAVALTGLEQTAVSDAGFWKASITVYLRTPQMRMTMLAMIGQAEGRANPWLVPSFKTYRFPDTFRPLRATRTGTFSDGGTFDDGGLFEDSQATGICYTATAARSRAMRVQQESRIAPQAGLFFSIDQRLYLCTSAAEYSSGIYDIRFWPGLREDVPVSAELDWDLSHCRMKLAADTVQLQDEMMRFDTVVLDFVEDFKPA
jgi:hypothetical protein